ncbi:MAG: hypothetical protein ABIS86_16450 [Streptosporangiaceae bacterium]
MTIVGRRFVAVRSASAYRQAADRAFRRVPFYREQWAVAGRVLAHPRPVPSTDLAGELFRLCPLGRPWRPGAEPSLWIGDRAALRQAVGLVSHARTVLEIRDACLDWTSLGRGVRYGFVLPPGADTVDEDRRLLLNHRAETLTGASVLVGTPQDLSVVRLEAEPVPRLSLGAALSGEGAALVHDRCLGYFAARPSSCGRLHLLWRRFHLRVDDAGTPMVTDLRRSRPTLVNVVPAGAPPVSVGHCPTHDGPVIMTGPS